MGEEVLGTAEFYTQVAAYTARLDPTWDEERWREQIAAEPALLTAALGAPTGRAILDASCGAGGQAIPLAQLGWRVTATDITDASLATARERARDAGLAIDFAACDMRDLGARFPGRFDCVLTCMALDNLADAAELQAAVRALHAALRPGGTAYIRLRDLDHLARARPRYDVKEERALPHGRVIRLEDWTFESDTTAICAYIFLHEDRRKTGHRWDTAVFRYRRHLLYKADLRGYLEGAGFREVAFLPQGSPWGPYEVVARKGSS